MTETNQKLVPDFTLPRWGYRHTIDTALASLAALGVPDSRIMISMIGSGLEEGDIATQQLRTPSGQLLEDASEQVLTSDVVVQLNVSGRGFFQKLPAGMWLEGVEELVQTFDDPIQRAKYMLSEAMRLYVVGQDDFKACARWIRLFGLNPEDWAEEMWYPLSLILPSLHRLAGTEAGIRLTLDILLKLPLLELRRRPAAIKIEEGTLSMLGVSQNRLGVDFALGSGQEDLSEIQLVIGAVPLETWNRFQTQEASDLLNSVLALCTPYHQSYSVSWLVLDSQSAPRLGVEAANSRLGVNSHLGWCPISNNNLDHGDGRS